ncbi:hypothetical protein RGQ15_13590 [Paracoccus sp. MBLB3053]|uniref:DUF6950 domain-containing protein n=1 Tax=Paracoccus aurantius TaxID=3073814 RepID=A0ABU2HU76_9RHOB|nr:hypothetical protein [Paracoccus sp. MBLB3053]MDS9468597.1 hypothetical protein [Paracoccus sp. MBLB3053]
MVKQTRATLSRLPNWRARLAAEMDRQRRDPFAWGSHDCALGLAAGAIEAITGNDMAAEWRGRYTTPLGALRVLRKAGHASFTDFVAAHLPEHDHPDQADIGDIGLVESDGPVGVALCIVDASGVIVMTETGHGRRPRSDMTRAFKVG